IFEKWTNTSSPPSREMKPKPFSALKNFTVPVVKITLLVSEGRAVVACARHHSRAKVSRTGCSAFRRTTTPARRGLLKGFATQAVDSYPESNVGRVDGGCYCYAIRFD